MTSIVYLTCILLLSLFSVYNSATFNCEGEQECKDRKIKCQSDSDCIVNCDGTEQGQQACQAAMIDASLAINVRLTCVHKQDCQDTELICGKSKCDIICYDNDHEQQCNFKRVICGDGPCTIYCNGDDSCEGNDGSKFTSSNSAYSFQCVGDCPPSFPSLSISTLHPTVSSTVNGIESKTSNPTITPTIYSTSDGTINPTLSSTMNGTKYMTSNPRKSDGSSAEVNGTEYKAIQNDDIMVDDSFDILEDTVLIILFVCILMVICCIALILIVYRCKMKKKGRKKGLDKHDINDIDGGQQYMNIAMKDDEDDNEYVNENKISDENIALKNDVVTDGCTAIHNGERGPSIIGNNTLNTKEVMNADEFIVKSDSYKFNNNKTADCHSDNDGMDGMDGMNSFGQIKTPSNSVSDENNIDIGLNHGEFVVNGDSDDNDNYQTITEGQ